MTTKETIASQIKWYHNDDTTIKNINILIWDMLREIEIECDLDKWELDRFYINNIN